MPSFKKVSVTQFSSEEFNFFKKNLQLLQLEETSESEESFKNLKEPIVIKNACLHWPAYKWSPQFLNKNFGNITTTCRIFNKNKNIVWEADCAQESCTLSEFLGWSSALEIPDSQPSESVLTSKNCNFKLIYKYPISKFWGYIDYKHFPEFFNGLKGRCIGPFETDYSQVQKNKKFCGETLNHSGENFSCEGKIIKLI
jgi:hypothetical protein